MPSRIHKTCVDGGIKSDYLVPQRIPHSYSDKGIRLRIVPRPFTSVICRQVTCPISINRFAFNVTKGDANYHTVQIPMIDSNDCS